MVTDIVKRAKIEPIVFYNRYKNLDEFYAEFVKDYDYWLRDLLRDTLGEIGSEEGYSNIIERLMNALMSDDIMTELLRWEIAEGNHITERTSHMREQNVSELTESCKAIYSRDDIDIIAITAVIVAGIYYLVLHKDRSPFTGIDINTPSGKHRIINAIRSISALMFHVGDNARLTSGGAEEIETYRQNFETACRERIQADFREHVEDLMQARQSAQRQLIAAKMREEGIPEDVIARCTSTDA